MASPGQPAFGVGTRDLAALRAELREQRRQLSLQLITLRHTQWRIRGDLAARREDCRTTRPRRASPLRERAPSLQSNVETAEALLRRLLAGGPMRTVDVQRRAEAAGISPRTLTRARGRLGVRAVRVGGLGRLGAWCCDLSAAPLAKR